MGIRKLIIRRVGCRQFLFVQGSQTFWTGATRSGFSGVRLETLIYASCSSMPALYCSQKPFSINLTKEIIADFSSAPSAVISTRVPFSIPSPNSIRIDLAFTGGFSVSKFRIVIFEENIFAFTTKSDAGLACNPVLLMITVCLVIIRSHVILMAFAGCCLFYKGQHPASLFD